MNYSPSEAERNRSAVVQVLAIIGFFIPGLIARRTLHGVRSPYLAYWSKVSMVWSIVATVLVVGGVAVVILAETKLLLATVATAHVLFCVMGAFASVFNIPFDYLYVGRTFCRYEMSLLWYDPTLIERDSIPIDGEFGVADDDGNGHLDDLDAHLPR